MSIKTLEYVSISLDLKLTETLKSVAENHNTSSHLLVLTGIVVLVHRYTGDNNIFCGLQFGSHGDGYKDNEFFDNMMVIHQPVSPDTSFMEVAGQLSGKLGDSYIGKNPPPCGNNDSVTRRHFVSHDSTLSVVFTFQRPASSAQVSINHDLRLSKIFAHHKKNPMDITFFIGSDGNKFTVGCEYNGSVFTKDFIQYILFHSPEMLNTAMGYPNSKISSFDLLYGKNKKKLTRENNQIRRIYPKHATFVQIFETQVKLRSHATAVVSGDKSLSYTDLDIASNRLSHQLRRSGVAPGDRVAVLLNRSTDISVSLIAILKSGCTYIPLDPNYPSDRLQYILSDSRPGAIITQSQLSDRLECGSMLMIEIDRHGPGIVESSPEPLPHISSPDDPAYIIYTSGSTGKPKGVVINHRSLVNLLCSMRDTPGLTPDDTVVCITTISFDMSVVDMFLPLSVGAKLVIADTLEMIDGRALHQILRRHAATFMQATPMTWRLLLEAGWRGDPPLKMLCGGEAMPHKLSEQLLCCGGELWNMYGPTETTVWSSAYRVGSCDGHIPIGQPISNTQFYILDDKLAIVPSGVAGELYIGGDGVACGYFEKPELTSQRFIPDSFRNIPAAKLYRTGDRVRTDRNGNIIYLGRSDHQVKLRGFRIELGEIESTILNHADVREAAVVLGQDASGESAIFAYVVPHYHHTVKKNGLVEALQSGFKKSLPAYMHPSIITLLETLPRMPNGKLDRQALPSLMALRSGREVNTQDFTDTEGRLLRIWSSILGHRNIEKTDDFFQLGGHSLLAARLLSCIETEFCQRLSLQSLFNAPNIAQQAKILSDQEGREYDFRQVVRLQPDGSKTPLIAIHNTGVYYYNLSRHLGREQPFTALQLFDPSIARKVFPQTLEEVASEYVQLIHKYQKSGPYKLIGWCVGGVLAFEVSRQLEEAGREVSMLTLIDAWSPGHNQRLSPLSALLSEYSFRFQLVAADWRKVISGEQNILSFVRKRVIFQKISQVLHHTENSKTNSISSDKNYNLPNEKFTQEEYDQWLLSYLDKLSNAYKPKIYSGKITLLRSAEEPHGLFLDPKMGWEKFALAGVDVAVIDGDHFTIFKDRGLKQMATHIASEMAVDGY